MQRLYAIEISGRISTVTGKDMPTQTTTPTTQPERNVLQHRKSTRRAALEAQDRIIAQSLFSKE